MSSSRAWRVLAVIGGTLVVVAATVSLFSMQEARATPTVYVYKTATCGCCANWVDHLREAGFEVVTEDVADLGSVKAQYGIPRELAACHTALVGGYVVEGHVPAEVLTRLLTERPAVTGIAVPGMPMGSPGMEGPVSESYEVVAFNRDGSAQVYDRR